MFDILAVVIHQDGIVVVGDIHLLGVEVSNSPNIAIFHLFLRFDY